MTNVLGSTHVVEQHSFSMFPSTLAFDFDLMFWSFSTFRGPSGLFLSSGYSSNTVLGSTHVVEQFLFSIVSSILSFEFDLILGSFLSF